MQGKQDGEDVFLNLAKSDGEMQEGSIPADNDTEDETTIKIHTLPTPPASRAGVSVAPRPRSSAHPLQDADNGRPTSATSRMHARNLSQPQTSNERIIRRELQAPRPESRLRRIAARGDGNDVPLFGRRRPSYLNEDDSAEGARPQSAVETPNGKATPSESGSVESQTAQSTVWDELDDLKSRIKHLEFGKGRTGSAAVQSHERPRTATTAPTTISSSAQQIRKSSITPSDVPAGIGGGAHPLLQSALAKAKTIVNPQLYRALEASAADALALTVMTGGAGPQGTTYSAASIINGATVSDRAIRRKADSMCRNLTDLCIALCDTKVDQALPLSSPASVMSQQRERPASRYERRSMEPEQQSPQTPGELRSSPGRTLSRLEGRRTSLGRSIVQQNSPQEPLIRTAEPRSPSRVATDYASQYGGSGHGLTRARIARLDEESGLEQNDRAPSRAMTEVGQSRQVSSHRRDFSNAGQQRSPSLRETLAARRANANVPEVDARSEAPASSSTTQNGPGRRNYLDRVASRGPASAVGATPSSERRRFPSLEHARAASRLESPLARTASLSQRNAPMN